MSHNTYESPFAGRYASKEMQQIFSSQNRYSTWRKLWVALATAEHELGLSVTQEQIDELKAHIEDINFERVAEIEAQTRHDVMAHNMAYGEVAPGAAGIIHLGATSCYITDNSEVILMRQAFDLLRRKLLAVMKNLSEFAYEYRGLPCLAYTHGQNAQPTTVGKRASLWLQDFVIDYQDLTYVNDGLRLLGNKGATGTQASFLRLFDGDGEKVLKLEKRIAELCGFADVFDVSGQTYTRKEDMRILNVLAGIAQSAYKFAQDMRLLQSFGELEEPFGKKQIGSSAMAYKRNPMRCERIDSIARFVICNAMNGAMTASTQWLERSLDDSANRRVALSEGFLALDGILNLLIDVTGGITVNGKIIEKRLMDYLPFVATENILMEAVKRGGDRQKLHGSIRRCSMEAEMERREGGDGGLLHRLASDPAFRMTEEEMRAILKPSDFVGLAPLQTERFLEKKVAPLLKDYDESVNHSVINV
ncbi:MAG: adenylosuccinate lyase [Oscillospiraceae bacterium]|nr:adenylosuccinate lyase [Oscillospiraceae bacterium]